MKAMRLAFTFLTVFPMGKINAAASDWCRAAVFFPLVGGTLGALLAAGAALVSDVAPPPLIAALALAAMFLLTRGLHTDGLSDSADGLMGGLDRRRSLQIMRSGTAGPMGVAAVVLVFLIKYAALISLPGRLPAALFFTPLSGRWSMVLAGALFKPARREGLGSAFISGLGPRHFLLATLVGCAPAYLGSYFLGSILPALTGGLAAFAAGAAAAQTAARRLGGLTGDTLGAVNEIAETVFLVAFVLSGAVFPAAP